MVIYLQPPCRNALLTPVAAFGIQRAQQKTKERAWKDLGLKELVRKGPSDGVAVRRMPR